MRTTYFADVILPLALPKTYTYRVPQELANEVATGKRVLVSFGGSKMYAAIVAAVHTQAPQYYQAKYLDAVLDEAPIVTARQLAFWQWLASYYLCGLGEVMLAAMPASLRLASETQVLPIELDQEDQQHLTDEEARVYDALWIQQKMSVSEIAELLDKKTVTPVVKSMLEKGAVALEEEVHERYKPLLKTFVRLSPQLKGDARLNDALNTLNKAPKQQDCLMVLLQQRNPYAWITKQQLTKKHSLSASALNGLEKRGFIQVQKQAVDRIVATAASKKQVVLSESQQTAADQIQQGFSQNKVALLHGVTGSGKTEIYIQLIEYYLQQQKQVLYLVPEIALTSQLTGRLEAYFGKHLRVYHSRFTNNERAEVWYKILENEEVKIVVGARSAALLPFHDLGLIIVDEEHDPSYKQQHPAPRYQARDAAIKLGQLHQANILLGSATPSMESFYNAQNGKYHYVSLTERYGDAVLPEILVADMRIAKRDKNIRAELSGFLFQEMEATLARGEQVILFQNRRGYAPRWLCNTCGWVPECKNCDISLTYHKYRHQLTCHYCGYKMPPPRTCMACGSTDITMVGFGTEKIEDELVLLLPGVTIGRMDYDTTRGKQSYQKIIHDFQDEEIQVLVGTQMVTKGLDFGNVGLVGVLSADQILSFPDFRAAERGFQLMTQVSGRAGRRKSRGKVIIQAFNPEHAVIQNVVQGDIKSVYRNEWRERQSFVYPPFCRLVGLTFKHRDANVVSDASVHIVQQLKTKLGSRVLGPEAPAIARIKNQYIMEALIKLDAKIDLERAKLFIQETVAALKQHKSFKSVRVIIDVDPY